MGLHSEGAALLPGLGCNSGSHSDSHGRQEGFFKEEGIGPLALVFVTGTIDGQYNSRFPKE